MPKDLPYQKHILEMEEVSTYLDNLTQEELTFLKQVLEDINKITNNGTPSITSLLEILDTLI